MEASNRVFDLIPAAAGHRSSHLTTTTDSLCRRNPNRLVFAKAVHDRVYGRQEILRIANLHLAGRDPVIQEPRIDFEVELLNAPCVPDPELSLKELGKATEPDVVYVPGLVMSVAI